MTCLETTFLIDVLRGKSKIEDIERDIGKSESIFIAAPSIMELHAGAIIKNLGQKQIDKINELSSIYTVLPLDERSAREAGEIRAGLIKKGETIEAEDIMIAAIAKVNGEKLVTRDEHYAKITGLKLLKY